MEQRIHVPNEGNEILANTNDPLDNPDASPGDVLPVHAPVLTTVSDSEAPNTKGERPTNSDDGDVQRTTESAQKTTTNSPHQQYGDRTNSDDPQRKAGRISVASDPSIEHSPFHPHYQVKSAGKGGMSTPSCERKGSSEAGHGLSPSTPGRSKVKNARGVQKPHKSSAVPKFGEWDEGNPSSADGYTDIFNVVKEERETASVKVPIIYNDSTYLDGPLPNNTSSSCCGFFSWRKK